MTPKEFVLGLMRSVVDDNAESYQDIFVSTKPDEASDPYWRSALGLYHSLTPDQRSIILEIMRQVSIDTVSNVLGVIDGVNSLENAPEEFSLLYGKGQNLSGDLQSLFLVEDEARRTRAR